MRVKSHWFKEGRAREPREVAHAVAFITWRVAQNALKRMRAARFDVDPGPQYFAFLSDFLIFLIVIADRLVYTRLDASAREQFTVALATRVGEILADNEDDLLGHDGDHQRRFIALFNERSADYASFAFVDDEPEFGFLRYLGARVTDIMQQQDQPWTLSQVMEIEAPEAVATIRKAVLDLLALEPRPRSRRAANSRGE
jgi:hypothetical protein